MVKIQIKQLHVFLLLSLLSTVLSNQVNVSTDPSVIHPLSFDVLNPINRLSLSNHSEPTCNNIHQIQKSDRCQFVRDNCSTREEGSLINYYSLYYCHFQSFSLLAILPIICILLVLFISLGYTALEYLCPNLHTIAKAHLKMPDNLAGLTILAFGNGAPDIFGTFEAMKSGLINLAISELLGASLFISTCVIGCIAIVKPFRVPQYLFVRDTIMYITVYVIITMAIFWGSLESMFCVALVLVYVAFVAFALYAHKRQKSRIRNILRDRRSRGQYNETEPGVEEEIDDVYLDHTSRLPTIDDVTIEEFNDSMQGENSLDDDDDNDNDINNDDNEDQIMGANIGTYGLKRLMQNLSLHSNLRGRIQLDDEVLVSREDASVDDFFNSKSNTNKWNCLFWSLFPLRQSLEDCESRLHQVQIVLQLPILILLKLTTPIQDFATYTMIQNDLAKSSEYTNDNNDVGDNNDGDNNLGSFDYEMDKMRLSIQAALGMFTLVFLNMDMNFFAKVLFLVILGSIAFLTVEKVYPDVTSDTILVSRSLLNRMNIINYITSTLGLLLSITWISTIASQIVLIIHAISTIYNLSDDLLGITLFALGNCVGDMATNYTIARMGFPNMAFSACFGGPLLALCSLGMNRILLGGDSTASGELEIRLSATLWLMVLGFFWNMAILCVQVPRNNWMLDEKICKILICNWVGCVVIASLSSLV